MKSSLLNKNKNISLEFIMIAIIVSIINSFFYESFAVMTVLTMIEVLVLLKLFFNNQDLKYLGYYMIFLSTSLESAAFVGVDEFYGFKNFRIAGVNLGVVFLLLIFFKLLFNGSINELFRLKGTIKKFTIWILTITTIAFFVGLVHLLFNDNNVATNINSFNMFIEASYIFILVLLEVLVIVTIIHSNTKEIYIIKQFLFALVIAIAVTMLSSYIFGNYGNRGGIESLQISNLVMLLICSILLPLYQEFNKLEKILLTFSGIVIFLLALIFNTNGKMIIVAVLVPFIILGILLRSGRYKTLIITTLGSIILAIPIFTILLPYVVSVNLLFAIKFEQVTSAFLFWKDDWFSTMPASPKTRISQFLNIVAEYFNKPWSLLTGKGYLGTIRDNLNIFGPLTEFEYSKWELDNKSYFRLHETFNTLLLTNGLIGLLFFLWMIKVILTKIHLSPWLMVGGLWFILFYAYSVTISIFGVVCLIVGLIDIEVQKKTKKIK
ncbi:hypothetical protein [Planomicrobium okeanokoites]|uniref:hypothetical protein n=1 Tax=Planomicrobium okeanokoites TaxID=244 RepID=UPI00249028F2|nr:hypothetical protein [Planomicrobium okeanokoites]